jgi:16S rRNA pseudouridine516 synthase
MRSKRARLDRFISQQTGISLRDIKLVLARGRVVVNGAIAVDASQIIDMFSHIMFDEQVLQDNTPMYIILNKPQGVVSATKDDKHNTVIDLINIDNKDQLHIAGRLDFNSTGLLLLTNNGQWSRRISEPEARVIKWYRVTLEKPIIDPDDYIKVFSEGIYFPFENITTRPAKLKVLSAYEAEVGIEEGRYHQVKRMFGKFQNRVVKLHRFSVGDLVLDPSLAPGESRELTPQEMACIG